MTLQPADLDRLEQLAREATPGPWMLTGESTDPDIGTVTDEHAIVCRGHGYDDYGAVTDAAYIAALSPAVVSELVAAARLGAAGLDVKPGAFIGVLLDYADRAHGNLNYRAMVPEHVLRDAAALIQDYRVRLAAVEGRP